MAMSKAQSIPSPEELEERGQELELTKNVEAGLVPLVESPVVNKLLLRNARKSANDISAITGIPPAEVSERLSVLLDTGNWRDDLQEEKLLLQEVGLLVDDIRTRMSRLNVDDEGWASMARVQLAALKTLMEQLAARRKSIDGQLSLVTRAQAQLVGEAIKLAQERAILNIMKEHPELDEELIHSEFEAAWPGAVEYVERQAGKN